MLNTFFHYFFFSSAILIYGIGMNRATVISEKPDHNYLKFIKMILVVAITSVVSFITVKFLLEPCRISELYPFTSLMIYFIVSLLFEILFRTATKINLAEFIVSILCVLLAVGESCSILECLVISAAAVLSFIVITPILFSIRKRIEIANPLEDFKNSSLLLISLAMIILISYVWNVSWLNNGVIK